ncbi:ABC transporter permease [Rariglobus hedericola]|uniref:Transport permease protein n=1 Tax=Rariglobus hedericola TaxID=2597822 RepID=A0A556QPV7_9BACT|nr:ABC transporter permease [Rariglobus hedericola]TSJ78676.1 ABC transporter permease [Rariglobus hedericola]
MSTPNPSETLVIEAGRAERHYWRDLWRYRELTEFLAWRDIKVRYKQASLGIAWALLQPVVTLVVFTFVFGRLAKMPDGGIPYPLLVLSGLLPWQLFSSAFSNASNSLVSNTHLVSKVYFPRLLIPLSSIMVALIDFAIVIALYALLALWFGLIPDWRIIALPFFILLGLFAALGAGLWLAALTVKFRDFRFIVPFILQVGLFLSPVGFSAANLPSWRWLISINPVAGVIDGFRWSLLQGQQSIYMPGLFMSVGITLLLVCTGVRYFRKVERSFADII